MSTRSSISSFKRALIGGLLSATALLSGCSILQPTARPEPTQYTVAPNAEGRWMRSADNLTLFGQWWVPATAPKAVVIIVHGTALHSGFYSPWANALTKQGYAAYGFDLRTWGQSQGFGRNGNVESYDDYVSDLELAYKEVKTRFPDVPVYLQGESMGGAVVLLASMTKRIPAEGLILNAPAVQPNPGFGMLRLPNFIANLGLWVLGTGGSILPNFPAYPTLESLSSRLVFYTDDGRQRFLKDPHNTHTALPAAYITGLEEGTKRIRANLHNLEVPFIVLHGTKDALVPLSSSELLMAKASSKDRTIKVYPGMPHATLHDLNHAQVWDDMVSWLNQQTQNRTAINP